MAEIEGSQIVARALKDQGVEMIFTVVGGPVIETVGACGDLGIRPIGCRHEQAAVLMAQAYQYVGGKPGVAVLASGPAVTNGITGVHVAWDNCWPVLVLGGSSALRQRGRGAFQETDSVAMMRPVCKWAGQVDSAGRVPELIALAMRKMMSGRPGPVYLDLPSDVLQTKLDEDQVRFFPAVKLPPPPAADPVAIERAADLLAEAERPVLLLGKGVRWSEPYRELRELVETLHLPFLPSPMGRGFLPDDHPLNMSAARSTAMRGADVVLVLGARLNWMFGMGRGLAPDAKIVQVDIDPAEIGHKREPEVGIVADAGQALRQLNAALEGRAAGLSERRAEGAWLSDLREARSKNEQVLENLLNSEMMPMTPHRLLKETRDVLPRDAIVTVDGQVILATGRQVLQTYTPASRLNSGSNGCMGVGVPFAIGAKLARPDAPVLSANGDCAFGFNGMEVETAVRTGANVVFLVDNNQGIMGGVLEGRMFHEPHPERVAMYTPSARYDKIMEAFGGYSEHVEQPDEVGPALRRAFASGRAALVDVSVDPNAVWPIPTAGARASALMGY
jgi:thiamine pyrophosphate-dependent acetolactate synthase large subunit-like protein